MKELTQKVLKESLLYCHTSGVFTWKNRPLSHFTKKDRWLAVNNRFAGKTANSESSHGYTRVLISGSRYYAHRLVWLYVYGEWPNKIDHIDGNRQNNKLINLRSVSNRENTKNRSISKTSSTGVMGVSKVKGFNRWRAYISVDKKQIWLGSFDDINKAIKARKEADKKYGFHKNHGRAI